MFNSHNATYPTSNDTPAAITIQQQANYKLETELKASYAAYATSYGAYVSNRTGAKAARENAKESRLETEQKHCVFARFCVELWDTYKAQGNRSGDPEVGIKAALKRAHVPEKKARAAIKRFFPEYWPKKDKGKKPKVKKNFVPKGNEVLVAFANTLEATQFNDALDKLGADGILQLCLEAL